jgi:uncharacterized protein YbcV (DUF1398 family)
MILMKLGPVPADVHNVKVINNVNLLSINKQVIKQILSTLFYGTIMYNGYCQHDI